MILIINLSLHQKHVRVSCSVMVSIFTPTVFNLNHHKVVETVDVRFDESDGSQREHLPPVLDETSPDELIKKMGVGDIRPVDHPEETHIPPALEEHQNPKANDPDP